MTIQSRFNLPKRFEFDQTYRYVSALPAQMVKSYSTADVHLAWDATRQVELSVVGENLFQPHHAEFGHDTSPIGRNQAKRLRSDHMATPRGLISMNQARDTRFLRRTPRRHRVGRKRCPCYCSRLRARCGRWWRFRACGRRVLKPTDYDVKAVYLYNFGRFVEWPASVDDQWRLVHMFVFSDRILLGRALDDTLAGENIGGKSVTAKRISTPQEAVGCQILFISTGGKSAYQNHGSP